METLRNVHTLEELNETWGLNVMWYYRWYPGTKKKDYITAKEI